MSKDKKTKVVTQEDIDKAIKKMESVAIQWFVDDPVMLGIWCIVDKISDPKMDTIGINSKSSPPSIRFNPLFVNSFKSTEYLEAIMASEGFKLLLKHPTTRLKKPYAISNMSSKVTINQAIMGGVFADEEEKDFVITPQNFGLKPDKWFEYYFQRLMEMADEAMDKMEIKFGSSSDEESGEGQSGEGQSGEGQSGEGQSSNDQESKEKSGDKSEDKSGEYKDYENQSDAVKDYMDPNGNSNQGWGENDLMDADISNMVNEKKGSTKDWGKFTGDSMGNIVAANTPKISYKEIIRRFNSSVMSSKSISSRMKVNRRYDLQAPGSRRVYKSKIIFAIDVSGSMSDEMLSECFTVLNSLCKHSELTYIQFDTEIKNVEKKFRKAKKNFKVHGRGGTDFNEVCQYAEKTKTDGLVIITDGYASAPKKPKGVKVLWLLTSKDCKPPCDFGSVAHLDLYEDIH